eukprot:1194655-Prorocentrum_minimum.AAC.1
MLHLAAVESFKQTIRFSASTSGRPPPDIHRLKSHKLPDPTNVTGPDLAFYSEMLVCHLCAICVIIGVTLV